MKHPKILSAAVFAAILAAASYASPAHAQNVGDAATGAKVATTWCANCHAVKGGKSAQDAAPPFQTLADERTDGEIRAFLARPHGLMPNIQLSRQQIEDVLAFFDTLR